MNCLISLALYIAVWFKYRKYKFCSIGVRCNYKSLRSSFLYSEKITLSDDVQIGPSVIFDGAGGINVGRGTIIAPEVIIYSRTHNFDNDLSALPFDNVMLTAPVNIGEYVWIGTRVIILPGVTIGDGAIIGAGAVVAKAIPSCAVVVGNPGRVIRYRNQETFDKLQLENNPFVFSRYAHNKIFKPKST